jgi:hypothetical protein
MFPTRTVLNEFVKRHDCPSSETLVSYARNELSGLKRQGIESHLAKCEFCDSESYLLARHPPLDNLATEPSFSTNIPLSLLLLAWQTQPTKRTPKRSQKRRAA